MDDRWTTTFRRELGPELLTALDDPDVVEILINPDGKAFANRHSRGLVLLVEQFPRSHAAALLATIAAGFDAVLNEESPDLSGRLPNGWRVQAVVPPMSSGPTLSLRRPPARILGLEQYVADRILTAEAAELLRDALRQRLNVLVSGGTGSGKTTFVNTLLRECGRLCPEDRLVTLEDTPELNLAARNLASLYTTPERDLRHLLRVSLRLLPTRIIVGETRGREALDLLKAWMTGHPGGLATIHANSALGALFRLDSLVQEANIPSQLSLIAQVVHRVVHLTGQDKARRVEEILGIDGLDGDRPIARRLYPEGDLR
jgi:type IV secretion system protein TrbB